MPGVLVDTQPSSSSSPLAFGTLCSPSFSAHPHPSASSSLPSLSSSSSPSPSPSFPSPSSPFLTISSAPQPPCEAPLPHPLLHFQQQQQLPQTPMELPSFSPPPSPSHLARELSQKLVPRTGPSRLSSSHGFATDPVDDNGAGASFDFTDYPDLNGLPIPFNNSYAPPNSNNSTIVGSPSSAMGGSPIFSDAITALQKFLPSNNEDEEKWPVDSWPAMDTFSCDDFRMYEFKVRRCMRGRSHDWTECPFAHPGEKARRRDPRRFHYSGTACPDFRKGSCKRGDACEYAHGVFECWLHPARYRTQPCKDGKDCKRRVCFFAHTVEQLRVLASSAAVGSGNSLNPSPKVPCYDGSPLRQALAGGFALEGYGGSLSDNGNLDGYGFSKLLDEGAHMTSSPRVQSLSGKKVKAGYGGVTGYGVASSPTSTLVGQSNSPPPLSPPLSPSISPPMSPVSPSGWHRSHSLHSHTHSPLSNSSVPAHRQHLNRLRSVPTIAIPSLEEEDQFAHNSPVSPSPQAIGELLASLQSLQFRARVGEDSNRVLCGLQSPQPWNHHQSVPLTSACYSRSFPGSPATRGKSNWEGTEAWAGMETGLEVPAHRVESGRDLRAKIYGKIGKDNGVSNDSPDLGWVNELVK